MSPPVQHPGEEIVGGDGPLPVLDPGVLVGLEQGHGHQQDVSDVIHLQLENLLHHLAVTEKQMKDT